MDQAGFWDQTPAAAASLASHPPGLCEQITHITDSVLRPHQQQKGLLTILRLDAQHGKLGRRRLR